MCTGIAYNLESTRPAETLFDIIFVIKIILSFFTWEDSFGTFDIKNLRLAFRKIAKNYIL